MRVKDIMSTTVESVQSTITIADAARVMAYDDIGCLPVLSDGRLVGIVTDRDIAVRGVAADLSGEAPIRRVMSENVTTCSPDDDVEDVLGIMGREQVRRMPVARRGKLVGMVTLADAAQHGPHTQAVSEALTEICEPSGMHCQPPMYA